MKEGITKIAEYAFDGCESLTSISIPASVTEIESCAFRGCTSLKEVRFAENSQLEIIWEAAFSSCQSLESFTVPKWVERIQPHAFWGCTGLKSLSFENTKAWCPSLYHDATNGTIVDVRDSHHNVFLFTEIYLNDYWSCGYVTP